SRASHGKQAAFSSASGLFAGGAQRTDATIRAPISFWPSPACVLVAWAARPVRWSEANSQSPLRSPVKIRPVRLPPCAAGARPTMSTRGCSSPHPATGRPQYVSSAKARRLTSATSSRQATRRGQARQTDCLAVSSASVRLAAASSRTSEGSRATGVAAEAGSSGHPVPGGTKLMSSMVPDGRDRFVPETWKRGDTETPETQKPRGDTEAPRNRRTGQRHGETPPGPQIDRSGRLLSLRGLHLRGRRRRRRLRRGVPRSVPLLLRELRELRGLRRGVLRELRKVVRRLAGGEGTRLGGAVLGAVGRQADGAAVLRRTRQGGVQR